MKRTIVKITAAAVALLLMTLPLAAMAENSSGQDGAADEPALILTLPSENSGSAEQNDQTPGGNGQMPGENGQMPGENGQMPGGNGQMPGMRSGENGGLILQDGSGESGEQPEKDGQFAFRDGRGERSGNGENSGAKECEYCRCRTLRIILTAGGAVLLAAGASLATAAICRSKARKSKKAEESGEAQMNGVQNEAPAGGEDPQSPGEEQ